MFEEEMALALNPKVRHRREYDLTEGLLGATR